MDPITLTALSLAAKYVPDIIGYFKGEKAGDIAKEVINVAQTVTGTKSPEAATEALAADPALAMKFRLDVMDREAAIQQMYLADTQSARTRDIELAKAGLKNHRANVLCAAALLLVIVCLFVVVWASGMDDYGKATITLILGRALGWVEQIFSFEFGTTRSNKVKDDTIKNLTK